MPSQKVKLFIRLVVLIFLVLGVSIAYLEICRSEKGLSEIVKGRVTSNHEITSISGKRNANQKLIVLYTKFFKGPWYLRWNSHFPCDLMSQCEFTYNQSLLHQADAVGFHDADIPDVTLPNRTNTNQIWFYFNLESPELSKPTGNFNGVFNWTMSYRVDSDVYAPYGSYRPLDCEEVRQYSRRTSFSVAKSKLIAWLVSNCDSPSGRSEFGRKLSEYLPVDIFGKCGNLSCSKGQEYHLSNSCKATLRKYKFYLAFENTNCQDYITEKYWEQGLENEMVPIVLGGANYEKLAVPGSYINVRDFKTVKELADYLKYLDGNNTAYKEYFAWKKSYALDTPYLYGCRLCNALHSSKAKQRKVYKDFENFWKTDKCQGKILTH